MNSRIEQIIEEIEQYVEHCIYQPLSSTKIVVHKDKLESLLNELRLKTPDEIKRYQKIISKKDAILADAQSKAENIILEAQTHAKELVAQTEIMQQAYAQADETVSTANQQAQETLDSSQKDANNIRMGAISYTDDMLATISKTIETILANDGEKYSVFFDFLQNSYDIVKKNRSEIYPNGSVDLTETTKKEENNDSFDDILDEKV